MPDNVKKMRLKFSKTGNMRFIGHLDVMRYFQKVIRKAEIPIRYSEGFHPHQIMSFASPLGMGLISSGEYVDMDLVCTEDEYSAADIRDRMNKVLSEGISILDAAYLPDKEPNAMASVAAASYIVHYTDKSFDMSFEEICRKKTAFFDEASSINIIKKTKKGEREVDLKPLIYRFDINPEANGYFFDLMLSSGSQDNIKPELMLDTFHEAMDISTEAYHFFIERTDLYKNVDNTFVPLIG